MRCVEHAGPWIACLTFKRILKMPCDKVQPDCMVFVTVDAAFALLHVDRITRQVPVDDAVAIWMEIQPFLPDGCRRQNERLEGGVKCCPHKTGPVYAGLILALLRQSHGKSAAQRDRVRMHDAAALQGITNGHLASDIDALIPWAPIQQIDGS